MKSIKLNKFILALSICVFSNLAFADCDCQQRVGTCTGAINFVKGFGSSPSYGAEIEVYSSVKQCSKVEYLVDNTPYQTILSNKNKDTESLFGTKPITQESVKYTGCYVCKNTDVKDNSSSKNTSNSPFEGTWVAKDKNIMGFENSTTYKISVANNVLSGSYSGTNGSGNLTGSVNGNKAVVKCSGCFTVTWNLIDDRTVKYSYPFGSGTIRKE